MAVSLPQGVLNELPAEEREHREDRDEHQHEHNAEGDYALLSSFTSDVPRHARQCRRARGNGPAWGEWEHLPKAEGQTLKEEALTVAARASSARSVR